MTSLYNKQIENLNTQLKGTKELSEKTLADTKTIYTAQIQNLQNQQIQKDTMIQQANNLASNYQKQLQEVRSHSGTNIVAIIIALIIGLIIGVIIMSKH